jgi:hypothetical protein
MKKIVGIGMVIAMLTSGAYGALTWGYSEDLLTWDATIQNGWLVQMYQDVDANSSLNSITEFDQLSGAPTGAGVSDDVLLSSFTAALQENTKDGSIAWTVDFASWSSLYNDDVYSVIYNAASIGAATQAVVVDASPFTLPGADPGTYSLSSVNNTWVAVPEPATFLMFALGGFGAWMIHRKNRSFFNK